MQNRLSVISRTSTRVCSHVPLAGAALECPGPLPVLECRYICRLLRPPITLAAGAGGSRPASETRCAMIPGASQGEVSHAPITDGEDQREVGEPRRRLRHEPPEQTH